MNYICILLFLIVEAGLTTLARVCVSAILLTHFPLQAHPARRSALSLWLAIQPLCNATQGVDDVCIDDSDHDQQLSSQSTESEKSLKLRKNIVTVS